MALVQHLGTGRRKRAVARIFLRAGKGDITVNAVTPAVIMTPLVAGVPQATVDYMVARIPLGRVGRPEEVAAAVHFLASAEAAVKKPACRPITTAR